MPLRLSAFAECQLPGATVLGQFSLGNEAFAGLLGARSGGASGGSRGSIDFGEILSALGLGAEVGAALRGIQIEQVLLACIDKKFLAGIQFGLDLDLSRLPLVGPAIRELTASMPLKLEGIQILISKSGLDEAALNRLRAVLPQAGHEVRLPKNGGNVRAIAYSLPAKLERSFDVTGLVNLGDFVFPPTIPTPDEHQPAPPAPASAPPAPIESADNTKWIEVRRTFGPVNIQRLGFRFDAKARCALVLIDSSFHISSLTLSISGLGAGISLSDYMPVFQIAGVGVSSDTGAIAISGSLIKVSDSPLQFDGSLLVRGSGFTLSAIASYANPASGPSFYAFAVLHRDLGGPACFHVLGLAFGLGLNRRLIMPDIDGVGQFPLIQAARESGVDISASSSFSRSLPVAPGNFWVAAGVLFSSFELVRSFALLSVVFGDEVQIVLLGLSTITIPSGLKPGDPGVLAFAELALRAVIRPAEGSIEVQGQLTNNSYVFDPRCKLTGGFAFYAWFAGEHAGDFVVTLGGYHPRFVRKPHYPDVPRLAVNWQVDSNLRVSGEMYYAITPSCFMTGGKLAAVYSAGWVEAWFVAYADFLINWQPFYYDVQMGISLGVAAHVRIPMGLFTVSFTIRVTLGVDLQLFGPPFAGEAHVDLSVVSFTIRFGPSRSAPKPIEATAFIQSFLPADARAAKSGVITTQISDGLIRQQTLDGHAEPLRLVNAHLLVLNVRTLVPITASEQIPIPDAGCGIRPMGKKQLRSVFRATVNDNERGEGARNLRISPIHNGVPEALWGTCAEEGTVPRLAEPAANTISVVSGLCIATVAPEPEHIVGPMPIEAFKYEDFGKSWNLGSQVRPELPQPGDDRTLWNTIVHEKVAGRRDGIIAVLSRQTPFVLYRPDLTRMSNRQNDYFQAEIGPRNYRALGEVLV